MLIILATVTVTVVLGEDGLIRQAEKAKEHQANAEASDREAMDSLDEQIANALAGDGTSEDSGETSEEEEPETPKEPEPVVWTNGTYNQAAQTVTNGEITLNIGDYVDYDCKTGVTTSSYTSPVGKNGYADQTFTLASYNYGWRVLGVDDEGRLLLIAEDFVPLTGGYTDTTSGRTIYKLSQKDYEVKNEAIYLNGVDELNNICAIYGQGEGAESARSVKVEDINKITGYNPETAAYGDGQAYEYRNEVTYTLQSDGYIYYQGTKQPTSLISNGAYTRFIYWTGNEWKTLTEGESAILQSTAYAYYPNTLTTSSSGDTEPGISTSSTAYKMLFTNSSTGAYSSKSGTTDRCYYWLGSSSILTSEGLVYFGVRYVSNGYLPWGNVSSSVGGGSPQGQGNGVRPVVTLSSDITLIDSGTDYDGCTLWNLN